jgi:5-oxopent-3-ene-1,2,5-tricarboxylate decarboxylase/2-hydroxyhepta-2,4-diene-1,7-dioate isomerase
VINKRGRYVEAKDAYDYVAGYTIGLDVTAHDILVKDWYMLSGRHVRAADPTKNEAPLNAGLAFRGKSFDTFAPLGPWIVTKDEIPDPHTLDIQLKINKDVLQDGNSRDMICRVPEFIKWVSDVATIEPGDVYYTGSLPDWRGLKDGDVLTATISEIGQLQVTCKAEGRTRK